MGLSWPKAGPARKAMITAAATTLMRVLPDLVFRISAQRPRRDTTTVRLRPSCSRLACRAGARRTKAGRERFELPTLSLQTIGKTPSVSTFKHLHDTLI